MVFRDALDLRDFSSMTVAKAPLISIVDDDALARDGTRELVESFGYRASTFESARHFLASNLLAETTCLITDVQTPGLSGLELQEALRSQGNHTPLIVITAYPDAKQRSRALKNGAMGFLSKPFNETSLMECLSTAINLRLAQDFFCGIAPRQVIDSLPAAIYGTDSEGYITYFNDAATALWGNRPVLHTDQWCGSWRLYGLDGTPMRHDQCPMAMALKEGRPIRGHQAIAERPDGTRVRFMPFPTPSYDASGVLIGAVNLLIEIGDRQRAAI